MEERLSKYVPRVTGKILRGGSGQAGLMPDSLQNVYARARTRIGDEDWPRLSAHEQRVAVYQEFRAADSAGTGRFLSAGGDKQTPGHTPDCVIRLRLVGQMEAWTVSGESVLASGRKTRALLAAVALAAPRPSFRGRLAELLWSRRPEEQARASLRQEIQLLLKALAPSQAEILHVTRDHIGLVPGAVWVDANEIMRSSASKQAALSLYDGELLEDLDGVDPAFDTFLAGERERLRDHVRGIAESLLREQSEPGTIIPAANRVLQIDRTHEEAWRALMRAHAEQGERGMAIQAFHRCRTVLADMLDAVPSAETQALMAELRGPSSKRLPRRPPYPAPEPAAMPAGVSEEIRLPAAEAAPRPREGVRIGVLAMRGIGLPEDVAWLGSSLAIDITMALTRFRWLSVMAATSSGLAPDAGGNDRHDPGVDYLLDGAIQRSRNKVRITLRLLDLKEDNQVVWARRFDRTLDDLLVLQEEISAEVAAQIDPIMLLIEAKRRSNNPAASPTAYDLILLSIPLITRLERGGFMRAGAHLAQAVELEPDNAAAHAWYASWHLLLLSQNWAADPVKSRAQSTLHAERGTALAPYSAGAFTVCGHVRTVVDRRPLEAAALHERALELNPNLASAWALSALTQIALGNTRDAERRYGQYKSLSPLDPYAFLFDGIFALVHVLKKDYPAAAAAGQSVIQFNPGYTASYKPYLSALGHLGEQREAEAVLGKLLALDRGATVASCLEAFPLDRPEHQKLFAEGLRLAGMA